MNARAARAAESLRELISRHQLLTFRLSPPFQGLMQEPSRRILLRAANRVGKTRSVAYYVASRMVDEPGLRARVVGPTNDHIHNVLGKYLAEFLEPHLDRRLSYYIEGRGWNGGRQRTISLSNGSTCELRSLRDDPDAHSGRSCHVVAFDEPPTLAHYTENAARLVDTAGTMIIAATMVNRPVTWLREMVQGEDEDPDDGRTVHGTGWTQIVAKFRQENCPWYDQEQIETWLDVMRASPWEWGQRIEAKWDGVTPDRLFVGVTEDNFSHDLPPGEVKIGIGIDHGAVAGHQVALLIAFKQNQIWVLDEHRALIATSPEEDAKHLLAMLRRHHIDPTDIDLAVGDTNVVKGYGSWRMNDAMQHALTEQLGRKTAPFRIQPPDKTPGSIDWGLRCINYAGRRGDLKIHPRCVNLTGAIRHWKGEKGRADEHGYIHIVDAFRYALTAAIGHRPIYAKLRFG